MAVLSHLKTFYQSKCIFGSRFYPIPKYFHEIGSWNDDNPLFAVRSGIKSIGLKHWPVPRSTAARMRRTWIRSRRGWRLRGSRRRGRECWSRRTSKLKCWLTRSRCSGDEEAKKLGWGVSWGRISFAVVTI